MAAALDRWGDQIAALLPIYVAVILLLLLGVWMQDAWAEVSPQKQAILDARGWSESDTLTSVPLVTEQAGDRHCERGRIHSAIRNRNGNPMVQGWTSIGACVTANGQLRILGVGYGQGSSGSGWKRKLPFGYPFLQHGWKDRPTEYRSWAKYAWSFGGSQSWWYLTETLVAIKRSMHEIVFVRKARWS